MDLPVSPPIEPMLAKPATTFPTDEGWLFEPKWDGFRALVFRDGDEVLIQSRDLKPLDRYFPELAAPLRASLPERCVLDGEVVIAGADGRLDFDALLLRIHPAESRVRMLAAQVAGQLRGLGRPGAWATTTCAARRPSGGDGSRRSWPTPSRRSTSPRRPAIGRPRSTGSSASRAPGWTA